MNDMVLGKIILAMSPEKEEYVFQIKKDYNKTRIFGPGYEKILADYEMKKGDRFMIEWDHPIDVFFAIFPEGPGDAPKERVLGTFFSHSFLFF